MQINFKKVFNWNIESVSSPVPIFRIDDFSNGKQVLAGYSVVVNYVYHGIKRFFFNVDSPRVWVMFGGPREAAEIFYHEMLNRQMKQKRGYTTRFWRQR